MGLSLFPVLKDWGYLRFNGLDFLNRRIIHTDHLDILGLNAALAYIGIVLQKEY